MVYDDSSMEDTKVLDTWVEIVDRKSLKSEVVEKNPELKDFDGLVLKKMHKSNLTISYEKIEGGLTGFLDRKLPTCSNICNFLILARNKFCA